MLNVFKIFVFSISKSDNIPVRQFSIPQYCPFVMQLPYMKMLISIKKKLVMKCKQFSIMVFQYFFLALILVGQYGNSLDSFQHSKTV